MDAHHEAWLKDHPEYDEFWLSQALSAGFDLHHIDGDHDNNEFNNLILLEKKDRQKLHGQPTFVEKGRNDWGKAKERLRLGEAAYKLRVEEGWPWAAICKELGYETAKYSTGGAALNVASYFARVKGKVWPIPHKPACPCSHCRGKRNKLNTNRIQQISTTSER